LEGYATSKALFEDYTEVVAKLEGKEAQEVKDSIRNRTKEIVTELKQSFPKNSGQ
jgi:hypothetical protein